MNIDIEEVKKLLDEAKAKHEEDERQLREDIKRLVKECPNMEFYLAVPTHPKYEVSNKGNVRNGKTKKVLKPFDRRGYKRVDFSGISHTLHRKIAEAWIDKPEGKDFIDHIDRNRGNNNITNLRWCTRSENQMNTRKPNTNTSGYRGVSYDKSKNKWKSSIMINGKPIHLGYFDDPFDAHKIYKNTARKHFGDFAKNNN